MEDADEILWLDALDKAFEEILQDQKCCNRCGSELEEEEATSGDKLCSWCAHVTYKNIDK